MHHPVVGYLIYHLPLIHISVVYDSAPTYLLQSVTVIRSHYTCFTERGGGNQKSYRSERSQEMPARPYGKGSLKSKGKVKVKAVCGSYSTAALRHIVLLPK